MTEFINDSQPSTDSVGSRLARSARALILREFGLRLLGIGGSVFLARRLAPRDFGLFAIALFAITFIAMVSELGLGAAFIRHANEPSDEELSVLFTVQLSFDMFVAAVLFIAAPRIATAYGEPELTLLVRALAVSLVIGNFATVPVILSERRLEYGAIAFADIAGKLAFTGVALAGAYTVGGGISLAAGTLASNLSSTAVMMFAVRWRPRVSFRLELIRHKLKFGLLYQGQGFTQYLRDMLIPGLGGSLYGATAVGYLNWALQVASLPIVLVSLVGRVAYPALSAVRSDRAEFTRLTELTLKWTSVLVLPVLGVIAGAAPEIIDDVYGGKWRPALLSLYLLLGCMVVAMASGILLPALYSFGSASRALKASLIWTATMIVCALIGYWARLGFQDLALAYLAGSIVGMALIVRATKSQFGLTPTTAMRRPLISSTMAACCTAAALHLLPRGIATLLLVGVFGVLAGLTGSLWGDRSHAWAFIAMRRSPAGTEPSR